jgi:hypothetical protein
MSTPEAVITSRPVRVFITYAWEDPAYRETVKAFAARLRHDGVEARLDAWHLDGVSIPEFMNREIRLADRVLILCSPKYRTKVHATEDNERVSGVGWEAMLVTSAIWTAKLRRNQMEVALFRGEWTESAPDFLQALPYIDLSSPDLFEANYLELLRRLTGNVELVPPLGKVPDGLRPPSTIPLTGTALPADSAPPVVPRNNASFITPERLEEAVSQRAETDFQAAFEKAMRSPVPEEVRRKLEANRSRDYAPFTVFDTSVNIQLEGSLFPLVATRIQVESDLRRKHRLPYSRERIEALKGQLNALAVDELVHIIRAAFQDGLDNVFNYYRFTPDYKTKELEEYREKRLNQKPEGVFKKISVMVDAARAQLILDLA